VDHAAALARTPVLRRSAAERPRDSRPYAGIRLASHRPAAVAQRRLADFVNASPRVQATVPSLPARASGRGPPVIQRAIAYNAPQVPGGLQAALTPEITAYNVYAAGHLADNTEASLHVEFRLLDLAERTINAYLRDHGGAVSDPERLYLFTLLRAAQTDHVALTDRTVAANRQLWVRGAAGLGALENARRQTLWQSLLARGGNIQVAGAAGFQSNINAGFARLLQGPHGTGLLEELNAAPPPGGGVDRRVLIAADHTANYPPASPPPAASFARDIASVHPPVRNLNERLAGGGANTGSGSYVQIVPHAPATLDDYGSDTGGRAIFSPGFNTLGHELGHARHHLRGTTERGAPHATLDDRLWSNPEERANITHEENPIRAEHGLPIRSYHATIHRQRELRTRAQLQGRLDTAWATVPRHLQGILGPRFFAGLANELENTLNLHSPGDVDAFQTRVGVLRLRIGQAMPGAIRTYRAQLQQRLDTARATVPPYLRDIIVPRLFGDLDRELQDTLDLRSAADVAAFERRITALPGLIRAAIPRARLRWALRPTRGKLLALGALATAALGIHLAAQRREQ